MKKLLVLTFISAICCAILFTSCDGIDAVTGKWKFDINTDSQADCDFRNGTITEDGTNRKLGTYTIVDERIVKINLVAVRSPTDSIIVDASIANDTITANFEGNLIKWEKIK